MIIIILIVHTYTGGKTLFSPRARPGQAQDIINTSYYTSYIIIAVSQLEHLYTSVNT